MSGPGKKKQKQTPPPKKNATDEVFFLEKQKREAFVFGLHEPNTIERRKAFFLNLVKIKAQGKTK